MPDIHYLDCFDVFFLCLVNRGEVLVTSVEIDQPATSPHELSVKDKFS